MDQDEHVCEKFGLEVYEDLSSFPLVKGLFSYEFAKRTRIVPLERRTDCLLVAVDDPLAFDVLNEARVLSAPLPLKEVLATAVAIDAAIERCHSEQQEVPLEEKTEAPSSGTQGASQEAEAYDLLVRGEGSPVVRLLNSILIGAIQQGASDVHFEPVEGGLTVRYRIDGILEERHTPPAEYQSQLLARIKVMAHLDVAEQRLPQDGRIKLTMGSRAIDFRVSSIPVAYGERIVLRILDKSNLLLGFDKLGMHENVLRQFRSLTAMSEGIFLVTGPTGSGKTTTLYSALEGINSTHRNIMTIEDPVEYKLPGLAQVGVNSKIGLTFSTGLRHILRQDPDVIMIGEIRDTETAEIAIQSALTGHLVLSTLHTNDAPSALLRLVDMGVEPYLISSAVIGVLAQRLVRCICESCKFAYSPTESERMDLCLPEGEVVYKGRGCPKCFGTGYRGRCGIYELMPMSQSVKKQLLKNADSSEVKKEAVQAGMRTLREDGARLVLAGKTTSVEVLRVAKGCEG